jgi:selenide,water dikinase
LAQVLRPLDQLHQQQQQPNLLVGLNIADDAAIYRLNDEQAIIATTDFFTPVVDDPYDYGAIAAANAMSDVYAMGGEVLFALNIAGFPPKLDQAIITEILRGGAEKVIEAGAIIAGGHTVQDEEPKYGLAVTGLVHPERYFTKGGAQPGDILVLTKPLGTGTISTALKRDVAGAEVVEAMVASMKKLNRCAAQAAQATGGIRAVTDITGFGLLGHSLEMTRASGVQFQFIFSQLPFLEGARTYATEFIFPGGASNNRLYFEKDVSFATTISEDQQMLLWDPQTSGGLLLAVPADRLANFKEYCAKHQQSVWEVGQVQAGSGIIVK